jgi:superfamily II DNA or RNA helicase
MELKDTNKKEIKYLESEHCTTEDLFRKGCGLYGWIEKGTYKYLLGKGLDPTNQIEEPVKFGQYGSDLGENITLEKTPFETISGYDGITSGIVILYVKNLTNEYNNTNLNPLNDIENPLKKELDYCNVKENVKGTEWFKCSVPDYNKRVEDKIELLKIPYHERFPSLYEKIQRYYQDFTTKDLSNKLNMFKHIISVLISFDCGRGKTLQTAFLIDKLSLTKFKNIMVISTQPSTFGDYEEALYTREILKNRNIYRLNNKLSIKEIKDILKNEKGCIFLASKQFLDRHLEDLTFLLNQMDILFSDEPHIGALTDNTEYILKQLNCSRIFLTATFNKVKYKHNIDYEYICNNDTEKLFLKWVLGKIPKKKISKILGVDKLNKEWKEYLIKNKSKFQKDINLIPNIIKRCVQTIYVELAVKFGFEEELKEIYDEENGYNIEKLYLEENQSVLKRVIEKIYKNVEYDTDPKIESQNSLSLIRQLKNHSVDNDGRDFIKEGLTILIKVGYFIGSDKNNDMKLDSNIDKVIKIFKEIRLDDDYNFFSVKSDSKIKPENLKEEINKAYNNARKENKNLIILEGAKLDTGINLIDENVDITINLSNVSSSDVMKQFIGRSLRPGNNKKFAYYIDMNLNSSFTSIISNLKYNSKSNGDAEYLYDYYKNVLRFTDKIEPKFKNKNDFKEFEEKIIDELYNDMYDNNSKNDSKSVFDEYEYVDRYNIKITKGGRNEDISGKAKKRKLITTGSKKKQKEIKEKLKKLEYYKVFNEILMYYNHNCDNTFIENDFYSLIKLLKKHQWDDFKDYIVQRIFVHNDIDVDDLDFDVFIELLLKDTTAKWNRINNYIKVINIFKNEHLEEFTI